MASNTNKVTGMTTTSQFYFSDETRLPSPFSIEENAIGLIDWDLDLGCGVEMLDFKPTQTKDDDLLPVNSREPELAYRAPFAMPAKPVTPEVVKKWETSNPMRRGGKKRRKEMPKRPLSAYNLFFKKERLKVFNESTHRVGFEDLGKIIGQRWKIMSADERKCYRRLAGKDATRYRLEMEVFEVLRKDTRERREPVELAITGDSSYTSKITSVPARVLSPDCLSETPFRGNATRSETPDETPQLLPTSAATLVTPVLAEHTYRSSAEDAHDTPREQKHYCYPIGLTQQPSQGGWSTMEVPDGMKVLYPDSQGVPRLYMVQYKRYCMSRREADAYLSQLARAPIAAPPPPPPSGARRV